MKKYFIKYCFCGGTYRQAGGQADMNIIVPDNLWKPRGCATLELSRLTANSRVVPLTQELSYLTADSRVVPPYN